MIFLACLALLLALVPCLLFLQNVRLYRPPTSAASRLDELAGVSVLIPARNEEANIAAAIRSAQSSQHMQWEVLVLDDHSEDRTAEIVGEIGAADARVRLIAGPPLPAGWNGKQHACSVLASHARFPWLVFMDADVRLLPDALNRMVGFMQGEQVALASGVPLQVTKSLMECLLVPLIHFVLLGFLPVRRMRDSRDPSYGAGCGQLFIAVASAYTAVGGHAAIRSSRHDGVQLPRAFRKAGFRTDLFDATDVATCRMYQTASEVWNGFVKNAHEGLAAPAMILPATIILFGGQVLPWLLLFFQLSHAALLISISAIVAGYVTRWTSCVRFKQSRIGACLHPVGILLLISVQWASLLRRVRGQSTPWKGRLDLPPASSKPFQQVT